MRGYIKKIADEHFWFDINDKPHQLTTMETSYITNCIVLLERRVAKGKFPDVAKAAADIDIFNEELAQRSQVRQTKIGRLVYV